MANIEVKLKLYKFIDMGDQDTRYEIFDAVQILTEEELRKQFFYMIENRIISQKEIDDYRADPDYKLDGGFTKIGTIVDMINDICNYNAEQYYIVQEINL